MSSTHSEGEGVKPSKSGRFTWPLNGRQAAAPPPKRVKGVGRHASRDYDPKTGRKR